MYRTLLSKRFFRENPVTEASPQVIEHVILTAPEVETWAEEPLGDNIKPDFRAQLAEERACLEAESDPNALFKWIRKGVGPHNQALLVKRAMPYKDEILPQVLRRLRTSHFEPFLEIAVRFLYKLDEDPTPLIMDIYDDIRSPYAQSLICLVVGQRGDEDAIPWLYQKYQDMLRRERDGEFDNLTDDGDNSLEMGPLLALYDMQERFYA